MTSLKLFENVQFGSIRILDKQDAPWFVAVDVAKSLGYLEPKRAIRRFCKKVEQVKFDESAAPYNIIPESDVYRLVMRSKLPAAELFQDWVVEDVLPSIRKGGTYGQAEITSPSVSIETTYSEFTGAKRLAEELGFSGDDALIKANSVVRKAIGVDVFKLMEFVPGNPPGGFASVSELGAKYLGGISASAVNQLLRRRGLQVRRGEDWLPTQEGLPFVGVGMAISKSGNKYVTKRLWSTAVVGMLQAELAA